MQFEFVFSAEAFKEFTFSANIAEVSVFSVFGLCKESSMVSNLSIDMTSLNV